MPSAPMRPCREYFCPNVVPRGYCPEHQHREVKRKHDYEVNRGSSTQRGYGQAWRKLRSRILLRDPICKGGYDITCGGRNLSQHCDHIVRREDGGTDEDTNLQGLCAPCHRLKTACENAGMPLPERVQFIIP